ncbi:MAG: hypothetical protein ACLQEQ_04855 [Nitrososphaerales archaeon]
MGIRAALGVTGRGYVKAARVFALVLIVSSPFIMIALAQSAQPQPEFTVTVYDVSVSTSYALYVDVSGTVLLSGQSQWSGGPIHFGGWVEVKELNELPTPPRNFTLSSSSFSPSSLTDFPSTDTANFSISEGPYLVFGASLVSGIIYAYDQNGTVIGESQPITSNNEGGNPTYLLAIQLPLINDSMLGATVPATDQVGNPSPVIPVSGIYNFIMVIALIVIAVGAAIMLFTGMGGDREKGGGYSAVFMQVVISVVIVLIFPLVYDQVAQLINYMSQTIIAYPNPPQYYNIAIQNLWNAATKGGSWESIITASLINFAVWVMELIAYLMVYFLGTVRILLIAVMIAAFPLAVALKMIPFTKKLSQMVEDTLFGLMLAAIMSAIIAGVALQIVEHFSGSYFEQAIGPYPNWVAIAAIFAIILMPTVFAPLTATMMQTVSQTAMAAGAVGVAVGAGAAVPAAGGAIAGGKAASGAMGAAAAAGKGFGGQLTAGLSSFGGTFARLGAAPAIKNAAIVGATGLTAAVGGSQASRAMRMVMPNTTGAGDVMKAQAAEQEAASNQLFIGQAGEAFGSTVPTFAGSHLVGTPTPEGLNAFDVGQNAHPEAVQSLQRLARSDDFAGAYNYAYEHRNAFGMADMASPASVSPEAKAAVGARFIQSLRPYKDDQAALGRIATNMNATHTGTSIPKTQP